MPLTSLQLTALINWTLDVGITGFADQTQTDPGQTFTISTVGVWNQLLAVNYSIANTAHVDYDVNSFTNLINEAASFSANGILSLILLPTMGAIIYGPGGSNPLTWFLGGTAPTITVQPSGVLVYSNPPAGPGQTVDGTHKSIRLQNSSGVTATGYLFAVGG